MSNYIIQNGELYHYGVLGMKWGKRKAREDFNEEVNARRKQLINKSAELDKQTKWYKWQQKHLNSDPDDYDDVADIFEDDPIADESARLYEKALYIDPKYVKDSVMSNAACSTIFATPLAMYITQKATEGKIKKQSHRVAAVLGAGLGAVAIGALGGYVAGNKRHKKALKSEGIKTVKERLKETKR